MRFEKRPLRVEALIIFLGLQVEYRPHASVDAVEAAAESPREALPLDCRPGFSAVWRAKERFQVKFASICTCSLPLSVMFSSSDP